MIIVNIELADLELARDALNTAHYKSLSEDMNDSYRQMDTRGRTSPLTKHFEKACERINAYIQDAYAKAEQEETDEPDEPVSE